MSLIRYALPMVAAASLVSCGDSHERDAAFPDPVSIEGSQSMPGYRTYTFESEDGGFVDVDCSVGITQYDIVEGDTLADIAESEVGLIWSNINYQLPGRKTVAFVIAHINDIDNPDMIFTGDSIFVPEHCDIVLDN